MKEKKVIVGSRSYTVVGLKGRDYCTCFHERVWGVLKNGLDLKNKDVKGYHYTINTVRRCELYLLTFFNKKFGAGDWDQTQDLGWNWTHHPEYLYFIQKRKRWMKAVGDGIYFEDHPELTKWMKTLNFHQKAIVCGYWLIINR